MIVRDRNLEAVQAASAALDRSHETVSLLRRISTSAVDAETGVRGFVITGAEKYLEPCNAALPRFDGDLARLEQAYGDTPERRNQLAALRARLGESQSGSTPHQGDPLRWPTSGGARLATGHNKATMDAVRTELDTIEAQARGHRRPAGRGTRQQQRRAVERHGHGLLGVAASIGFIWSVRRNAAQRPRRRRRSSPSASTCASLASIGDGVIVTDTAGCITMINRVTEQITGWSYGEAVGAPLEQVFRIVNEDTRQPMETRPPGRCGRA